MLMIRLLCGTGPSNMQQWTHITRQTTGNYTLYSYCSHSTMVVEGYRDLIITGFTVHTGTSHSRGVNTLSEPLFYPPNLKQPNLIPKYQLITTYKMFDFERCSNITDHRHYITYSNEHHG